MDIKEEFLKRLNDLGIHNLPATERDTIRVGTAIKITKQIFQLKLQATKKIKGNDRFLNQNIM